MNSPRQFRSRRFGAWIFLLLVMRVPSTFALDFPEFEIGSVEFSEIRKVQRTLTLLTKATKENPTEVRIAFCGTPFSNNTWWTNLTKHLATSYPEARIRAEFHGIERHFTEHLVRFAEHDLYPTGQDLIILQTVGYSLEFQRFVTELRERTSSDVIVLTDIPRNEKQLEETTDPKVIVPDPASFKVTPETWPAWYNNVWLPMQCAEKKLAKADVRGEARKYLTQHGLKPEVLLLANHQLTELGNKLILETLKPYFELSAALPQLDPWDGDVVSTYRIPKDRQWKGDRVTLEATGNRIELVLGRLGGGGVSVTIDGKPPSEIPDLRIFTKFSTFPNTSWPVLLRVGNNAPLIEETWKASVRNIRINGQGKPEFDFEIEGSKTGPDGSGQSGIEFLSKSQRVSILPEDWNLLHLSSVLKLPLPSQLDVTWQTMLLGANEVKLDDLPDDGTLISVSVASALKNGRHRIEIAGDDTARKSLKAIRIYRPFAVGAKKKAR